jgi:hypothetical protein
MKVGFILECQTGGPDASIYKYVAEKLCSSLFIEKPETMVNKKRLMEEGPVVAQTLFESGCDYVFIIWDRKPRWENQSGNCRTDREALKNSLSLLGVDNTKIYLCCIDEMLESWLIADSRGFMSWIRSKTPHALPEFGDHKNSARQASPKDVIKRYLRDHYARWKYDDYEDNIEIVKRLPDFNRAANWNYSFRFFKESIEEICPN